MTAKEKRSCFAGNIDIASDFECGNGDCIQRVGQDHFSVVARRDPGSGHEYNRQAWFFCVSIRNSAVRQTRIQIDFHVSDYTRMSEAYVWSKGGENWELVSSELLSLSDETSIVRVNLAIPAGETVYLSNGYWYPPSRMEEYLRGIASEHSDKCCLRSVGRTLQGRDIFVLSIPKDDMSGETKRIIVAGSSQPSELGPWACQAIIDFVLFSEDPIAGLVRKEWAVDVLPHTNPDGSALGMVMTNSRGENPFFDFDKAASQDNCSAEASHIWRWVANRSPDAYLEYHSYYQSDRDFLARPYVLDENIYIADRRKASARRVTKRLIEVSDGPPFPVKVNDALMRKTLFYKVAEHMKTISYIYKLHMRRSLDENMSQAVKVFKAFVAALVKVQMQEERNG